MNALFTLADVLSPVQRALRLTATPDLTLAVQRIDLWHRELCDLADWPALRAVATVPATGLTLALADAAGIVAVAGAVAAPYWYVERLDAQASDLAERRLWSFGNPARNTSGDLLFDAWEWDVATSAHVPAPVGVSLTVSYWKRPSALSQTTDRLSLPSTRALVVRAVLDLVGLMDRKDVDVQAWRSELEPAMAELRTLNPVACRIPLRLASGRILTRGPSR